MEEAPLGIFAFDETRSDDTFQDLQFQEKNYQYPSIRRDCNPNGRIKITETICIELTKS